MIENLEFHDINWASELRRRHDGAPLLPPLFVIEQGPTIRLVDLGGTDDGTGPVGTIPGSAFVPPEALERVLAPVPDTTRIVLVSGQGQIAADWALRLERSGRTRVAALEGGLVAWRRLGLRTERSSGIDPATLLADDDGASITGPLTIEDVRRHVGDVRSVRWMKALAFLGHGRLSCVDGRDERGVIGTPGGDAGEFLLTLATLESVQARRFEEDSIRAALLDRFDAFGDFYMHSDVDAMVALQEAVRADAKLAAFGPETADAAAWTAFLNRPPAAARDALLGHLTQPGHVGCGHLRLMQQHSEAYGVRRGLVEAFSRAAWRLLWDGAPELHLSVLPGSHREGAVLNVLLAEEVWALSWIPLVSPACRGTQVFVNHPQVADILRRNIAEYMRRSTGTLAIDASQEEAFQETKAGLAQAQAEQTLGHLAPGLPVYHLTFERSGRCEVQMAGAIPD